MNNHVNNLESFDIFQSHMHVARNGNPNNPNRPTLYKVPMLHIYNYAVALPIKLEFQKTFAIINFLLSTRIGLDKAALETIKTTLQGVFEKPYTTLDAQTSIDVALTGITNLIKDHKNEVLFKALKHKKEHLILMLIALPWFDLNAKNTSHGNRTPLMYAAEKGYLKTARFLLQKNVNIDDKKSDGLTPLMFAAYNNRKEIVALLLEKGANINDTDHDGRTALMIATDNGHHDIVDILQDASKKSAAENVRKKLKMDV